MLFRSSSRQVGVVGQVFVPGFGLRPIIQESNTSGGFHRVRGFRSGFGFGSGFGGFFGGFSGRQAFGFGYVPFYPSYSSYSQTPTVIVVQQAAPVAERVITMDDSRGYDGGSVVVAGLPDNWSELDLAEVSSHRSAAPTTALTLIALKDETLFAATEYWLEDGLIFYVTSTGRQGSVPLRSLDWDMTTRLNAERGQEFVLSSR